MPTFNGNPANNPAITSLILNEQIFLSYGGLTGTSSIEMRNIAYLLAENQMEEYISSHLVPTNDSETYLWLGQNPINLNWGNVSSVSSVVMQGIDTNNSCEIVNVTGCHAIRGSGKYGYIDVASLSNCGGCGSILGIPPYNVVVNYTSGLVSGTYTSPYNVEMLQALVLAAQINLNELDVSLSNESIADIGIKSFSNQRYNEIRMTMSNSAFGNSPVANRISRLVRKYRTKPSIGFH